MGGHRTLLQERSNEQDNQSNAGSAGSKTENTGAAYVLLNSVRSTGSNKADNVSAPSASKCPQFPANNQTVSFAAAYVCE